MTHLILTIALYYISSYILRNDHSHVTITSPIRCYDKPSVNFHECTSRQLIAACKVQGIKYTGMNKAQMIEELYSYTY
jgi:hypothetical protein